MKRIYERIVVSDTPPTSDSLWIDTSGKIPVLKTGAGFDWRPILGSASSDGDNDLLHIDLLKPDVSENGGRKFWYFQGDTSIFENKDTIELTVDNFDFSHVSLAKQDDGPEYLPYFYSEKIMVNGGASYEFLVIYNDPTIPNGYNIGIISYFDSGIFV